MTPAGTGAFKDIEKMSKVGAPHARVKLSIEARGLASMDWTSKSDPMAFLFAVADDGRETLIGNTEWIKNKTDVKWSTLIEAEYHFERKQKLIFKVMDVDNAKDPLNGGAQEIGHAEATMSKVLMIVRNFYEQSTR
jgi:hypothetical protein